MAAPPPNPMERLERELGSGRLPIVRYVPAPDSCAVFNRAPAPEWLAKWVPSDLPSVCIDYHNASCDICLMDFEEPPQLKLSSLGTLPMSESSEDVEPLRQLGCRHVFHQLCIDTYLQSNESGRFLCPICHEKVLSLASDLDQWEAEFAYLLFAQREDGIDYRNDLLDDDLDRDQNAAFIDGSLEVDEEGLPVLSEYTFESDNKYLDPSFSACSLLSDARDNLQKNGSLSEAALLLEAAIQKADLGECLYEAWILLGDTRSMDERESAAMRALAQGVRQAQGVGAVGAGMLSLAISYANESYNRASHTMLLRWLLARFPTSMPNETFRAIIRNPSQKALVLITDAFLSAARAQCSQGFAEVDVQVGLGILFHTQGEYDRAKTCFGSAIANRPKDYLLWNRLGASLCSGKKADEALGAYREALKLRPMYTRAIYNVGVSYWNLGVHREAAEHFLKALALQESTAGDMSEQLWTTLRRLFVLMKRPDLANLSQPGAQTSLDVYRREGFNF